jgi:hypothetical protein
MNSPGIIHDQDPKLVETHAYNPATGVSHTSLAKRTPNRISLVIWDFGIHKLAESVRLQIIAAPLTLIFKRW